MFQKAICPCNLQCNFCRKKYCRLHLGCQTYATCFASCNEIIFYARRVFINVSGILIMSHCDWFILKKTCETSCSRDITRCNLLRSIAKSRSCFYFLCNLQRNFLLRDMECHTRKSSLELAIQSHCGASDKENCLVWHGLYDMNCVIFFLNQFSVNLLYWCVFRLSWGEGGLGI